MSLFASASTGASKRPHASAFPLLLPDPGNVAKANYQHSAHLSGPVGACLALQAAATASAQAASELARALESSDYVKTAREVRSR
eukprot:6201187-Pleurochrysis_carterae.AAC.1